MNAMGTLIAKALGWVHDPSHGEWCWQHPSKKYWHTQPLICDTDLNALAAARDQLINTPELRIRWVNTMRDVVGRTCTRRNKLGHPLVSDIDLLFATPEQLAKTLVLTLKLKPATES